jgi:hypothetical protein
MFDGAEDVKRRDYCLERPINAGHRPRGPPREETEKVVVRGSDGDRHDVIIPAPAPRTNSGRPSPYDRRGDGVTLRLSE